MEYGILPEVIGAVTVMLIAFGGGIKWILVWSDSKVHRIQEQLELQYVERFTALEQRVSNQSDELDQQRDDLARYLRHLGKLEGLLQAHGIEVPSMEHMRIMKGR